MAQHPQHPQHPQQASKMRKRCEKIFQNSSKFKKIALHSRPCIVLPYERAEPRIVSHPVMAFFPRVSPRSVHNMLVHLLALPSATSSTNTPLTSQSSLPSLEEGEAARKQQEDMLNSPFEPPPSPSWSGEQLAKREERIVASAFRIMDAALETQVEEEKEKEKEKERAPSPEDGERPFSAQVDSYGVLVCGCGGTLSELEECVRFGYVSCDRCGLCHSTFIDRGPPRTFFEDGESKHYWQRAQDVVRVGWQQQASAPSSSSSEQQTLASSYTKRREDDALVSWSKDMHHYATLAGLSVGKANEAQGLLVLMSFQQRISNSEVAIAAAIIAVSVTSWFVTEQEELSAKREREEEFACRHCGKGHARSMDVRLCGMERRRKGRMRRLLT